MMVTLPHKYKGLFDREHEILGWKGNVLMTKVDGRVWTLSEKDTTELLQSLNLKPADIPGKQRAIANMEIEEEPGDVTWEDFPRRRGIVH